MNRYTLTLADGTTRTYARKIDAVRAGDKTGAGYRLTSPSGVVVADTIPAAPAAPAGRARAKVGSFEVAGNDDQLHVCVGACGATLPVKKFPTTSDPSRRVAECRGCRDDRLRAARAAA